MAGWWLRQWGWVLSIAGIGLSPGCDRDAPSGAGATPIPQHDPGVIQPKITGAEQALDEPHPASSRPAAAATAQPPRRTDPDPSQTPWILDEVVDVAGAGPASASPVGIAMITRRDELLLAPLGPLPRGEQTAPTPITPLPTDAGPFPLARGPAIAGHFAYWVAKGRLLRRRFSRNGQPGPLEILAEDARAGTRTAVPRALVSKPMPIPALVAYIARGPNGPGLVAKLWIEGGRGLVLTPEGAAANSVALLHDEQGLLALSLEARSGMSSVHLRRVRFEQQTPRQDPDQVVWVGGGCQPLSEVCPVVLEQGRVWGVLPTEQDITHFGLAQFSLENPSAPAETHWHLFANGIDPSPVASANVCGQPVILHAEPSAPEPNSPQELRLSQYREGRVQPGIPVARSRAFFDVSISELRRSAALLAYSADRRTWARTLRCRRQR